MRSKADISQLNLPHGDRTFAAAGPRLRNSLPVQLRNPDITYGLFRRQLKGHFFREARTRRSVTSDMLHYRKTPTYLLISKTSAYRRRILAAVRVSTLQDAVTCMAVLRNATELHKRNFVIAAPVICNGLAICIRLHVQRTVSVWPKISPLPAGHLT